jgi:NAD(P)-dependent dehydrogenase (short-subunit alcohol dehydrogenase family)
MSLSIMSTHQTFDPSTEIPSLKDKVVFVTGGTAGLGRETILKLAPHQPSHIYFSGRSQSSADALISSLHSLHASQSITFVPMDLASMESIKAAGETILPKLQRLDIFFANAGIMASPPGLTKDGYEIQFGTNHMGHAALVNLLVPTMERTAKAGHDVRIIWTTSLGHKMASTIAFDGLRSPQAWCSPFFLLSEWYRYGASKLANLLYAREFAARRPEITSVSVHPGVAFTSLLRDLGVFNYCFVWLSTLGSRVPVEQCAWNQLWAATAPKGHSVREVVSGTYYEPVGVAVELTVAAKNDELASGLWEWTQKELAKQGFEIAI